MNALFGICHLDGAPVDPADLVRMQASLACWGSDGAFTWRAGVVGMGAALQQHAHAGGNTPMPAHDAANATTLVASARLTNSAELAAALNLPPEAEDDALILAAYQRWGNECVHQLDGDWHFALWDAPAQRLLLARDHYGSSSLYYHHSQRTLAFASTQRPLLALPGIAQRPNLLRVAQILTYWPGDGHQTAYADIQRLPPAHYLTLDGNSLRLHRYWFPELLPEQRLGSDDDYVAAMLEVFGQAVRKRTQSRGRVGVMLSGGLDSGGVATLAAAELGTRNEKLHAFTGVPVGPPALDAARRGPTDEGPLAAAVASHAGNIILHLVDAAQSSPLAGIDRMLAVHDEPSYPASNSYWLDAIYTSARNQGMEVVLAGTLGNGTVSWSGGPPGVADLLGSGSPEALWKRLETLRVRAGVTRRRALFELLIKPVLRPCRQRLQTRPAPGREPWHVYAAIQPAFARQLDLAAAMHAAGHSPTFHFRETERQLRWRSVAPGANIVGAFHFEDGGAYGLDVLDPTADRRVIEFCAAVPEEQYHNGVESRWLMRRALRGYLPDAVRLQRRRSRQSADIVTRVQADQAAIAAALTELQRHALSVHVLDLARMEAILGAAVHAPASVSHHTCSTVLLNGLMVGRFLARF